MKFRFVVLLLSFILTFFICQTANAEESSAEAKLKDIRFEQINSESPQYLFKRLGEKFQLLLPFFGKEQKAKYISELLERRYRELAYLVINNRIGKLENAVSRYNTTIGEITTNYKDIDSNLKNQVKSYPEILGILRDKFRANSAQWLLMQYTVDTTRRLL